MSHYTLGIDSRPEQQRLAREANRARSATLEAMVRAVWRRLRGQVGGRGPSAMAGGVAG